MKKTVIACACIALSLSLFADNRVASTTKEATVYLNGAKLYNTGRVSVPTGNSEVIFENLSPSIYSPSVQVKLEGKVKLLSAKFRTKYIEGTREDAKIIHLQDTLQVLAKEERVLNDDIFSYQQEEAMLKEVYSKMINSSSDWVKAITPIGSNDFKQFPEEYVTKLRKIKEILRELDWKKEKLEKENLAVQNRIRNLAPKNAKTTGEIVLQVHADFAQSVDITCIYLITNANWTPLYDISSEGTDKPIHLTYKGAVRQTSGIDWKNIKLKLSTSNPFVNNSRPVLNPIYVDYYIVYNERNRAYELERAYSTNMAQVAKPQEDMDKKLPTTPAPPTGMNSTPGSDDRLDIPVEVASNHQVFVELDVPLTHDVATNGEEQIIEVEHHDIQAQYQYHAVPKLECAVFLLAKVTNYGQYNLMPGNANIFYQNTLIGQSYIDPKTVADTMLLSFGRDENISIKRTKAVDVTAAKVIGLNKKETIAFDINIKNNRGIPINIEILDQIPISKNAEIEVTPDEISGAEYIKDYGKLMWRLAIPANQSKKIRFSYTVKYPKDKNISLQ